MATDPLCHPSSVNASDDYFNDSGCRKYLPSRLWPFYQIPKNSGPLFNVTQVLDTYVYRGIAGTGDIGMAIAAGLYQSVVGCILVVVTNLIVRRFDKESALF